MLSGRTYRDTCYQLQGRLKLLTVMRPRVGAGGIMTHRAPPGGDGEAKGVCPGVTWNALGADARVE